MTSRVQTLSPRASIDDLVAVLDRGMVGVIVDGGALYGLIERSTSSTTCGGARPPRRDVQGRSGFRARAARSR